MTTRTQFGVSNGKVESSEALANMLATAEKLNIPVVDMSGIIAGGAVPEGWEVTATVVAEGRGDTSSVQALCISALPNIAELLKSPAGVQSIQGMVVTALTKKIADIYRNAAASQKQPRLPLNVDALLAMGGGVVVVGKEAYIDAIKAFAKKLAKSLADSKSGSMKALARVCTSLVVKQAFEDHGFAEMTFGVILAKHPTFFDDKLKSIIDGLAAAGEPVAYANKILNSRHDTVVATDDDDDADDIDFTAV